MSFKRISVRQGWRVYGMDARCDCTSTVLCKETKGKDGVGRCTKWFRVVVTHVSSLEQVQFLDPKASLPQRR